MYSRTAMCSILQLDPQPLQMYVHNINNGAMKNVTSCYLPCEAKRSRWIQTRTFLQNSLVCWKRCPKDTVGATLLAEIRSRGSCGGEVAAMWRQRGGDVAAMWRRCGGDVSAMWWRCGGNVAAMWWRCGGNVATMRWRCVDKVATT